MWGGGIKEIEREGESNYNIYDTFKNFYKCHNVPQYNNKKGKI
jgi:hypothetical protein